MWETECHVIVSEIADNLRGSHRKVTFFITLSLILGKIFGTINFSVAFWSLHRQLCYNWGVSRQLINLTHTAKCIKIRLETRLATLMTSFNGIPPIPKGIADSAILCINYLNFILAVTQYVIVSCSIICITWVYLLHIRAVSHKFILNSVASYRMDTNIHTVEKSLHLSVHVHDINNGWCMDKSKWGVKVSRNKYTIN